MYNLNIYFIIMSFATLLAKHTASRKSLIRNIEQKSRKIADAEAAVVFNNICIENNLLPKYIGHIGIVQWLFRTPKS